MATVARHAEPLAAVLIATVRTGEGPTKKSCKTACFRNRSGYAERTNVHVYSVGKLLIT